MTRPTARRALFISLAVGLLMHAALLQGFAAGEWDDGPARVSGALPAVQVRSVAPEAPPVMAAIAAPAPVAAKRPARPRPAVSSVPAVAPAEPPSPVPVLPAETSADKVPEPQPELPSEPPALALADAASSADTGVAAPEPDDAGLVARAATAQVSASTPAAGEALPTYRTALPPPVMLHYGAQSDRLSGTAELSWKPNATRYEARLEMRVSGLTVRTWHSEGAFDAAGIAPERFTDERRFRSAQAANFRRDSARITFSGPSNEYPLHAGTQDRLTWLLQVPGIVAANPQRFKPGSQIRLFVVGARGDADVWVLRVQGSDELRLADGRSVRALRVVREATGEHGMQAEVWLDPTRHHLPVRVLIGNQTLELLGGLPAPP